MMRHCHHSSCPSNLHATPLHPSRLGKDWRRALWKSWRRSWWHTHPPSPSCCSPPCAPLSHQPLLTRTFAARSSSFICHECVCAFTHGVHLVECSPILYSDSLFVRRVRRVQGSWPSCRWSNKVRHGRATAEDPRDFAIIPCSEPRETRKNAIRPAKQCHNLAVTPTDRFLRPKSKYAQNNTPHKPRATGT